MDFNLSLVGKYPVIQKVFDTTRREISQKEFVITELQKPRQRKETFEKAQTSKGYKPSRICWDFPLCYLDIIPSLVGKYPEIQIVFDTTRREISREELVITGFQKSRQSKGKLEKAPTSKGYNPSRICWDFSLLNSDINLSLIGKYTEIETVVFTV